MMDVHSAPPLNQHVACSIIVDLLAQQEVACRQQNFQRWLQTISIEDQISVELYRVWFEQQFLPAHVQAVHMELVTLTFDETCIKATVESTIEYVADTLDRGRSVFTVQFIPSLSAWRITSMDSVPGPFIRDSVVRRSIPVAPEIDMVVEQDAWWQQTHYLHAAERAPDPLAASLYAKAVARTVRYREEHPEIECAAILADMMASSVARLAIPLYDRDALQVLANLYYFSLDAMQPEMSRNDRADDWRSKLYSPWFGFDELRMRSRGQQAIAGSCPSLLSFYHALLRLSGLGPQYLAQLRLHNSDALVMLIGQEQFILGTHVIRDVQVKSFHVPQRVYKIFSDMWYWTQSGITNTREEVQPRFLFFMQGHRYFSFTPAKVTRRVHTLADEAALAIEPGHDAQELHRLVKERVLTLSCLYPYASYTWAKYAYQTLFVRKPEAYAVASLKSMLIQQKLVPSANLQQWLVECRSFGQTSIFPEQDRLMVAEQVLRYRTGDLRARALFLFTLFTCIKGATCFVLFTDAHAYCVCQQEQQWIVWDALTCEPVASPVGTLLLAFDEQGSVFPLLKTTGAGEMVPAWYHVLRQL